MCFTAPEATGIIIHFSNPTPHDFMHKFEVGRSSFVLFHKAIYCSVLHLPPSQPLDLAYPAFLAHSFLNQRDPEGLEIHTNAFLTHHIHFHL